MLLNPSAAKERRESYQTPTTNSKDHELDPAAKSNSPSEHGPSHEHSEEPENHNQVPHQAQPQIHTAEQVQMAVANSTPQAASMGEHAAQATHDGRHMSPHALPEPDNDLIQIGGSAAKMSEAKPSPSVKDRSSERHRERRSERYRTTGDIGAMSKGSNRVDAGHVNDIRRKIEQWSLLTNTGHSANVNLTSRGVDLGKLHQEDHPPSGPSGPMSPQLGADPGHSPSQGHGTAIQQPAGYTQSHGTTYSGTTAAQAHVLPFENAAKEESRDIYEEDLGAFEASEKRGKRSSISSRENVQTKLNSANSNSPSPQQLSNQGSSTFRAKEGSYYRSLGS